MRTYIPWLLLVVVLNTAGQISIKKGVVGISGIAVREVGRMAGTLALSGWVWTGLVLYGASLALWLVILSRVELSFAYPFLSLSYVLVLALGAFALQEAVNPWRIGGVACIVVGLVLISRSV